MNKILLELVDQLPGHKVMIIGDMVADVYLEGKISRISREAPVLVLEHASETVVPGGAANVCHNAVTLGGDVYAVGVVGEDNAGKELLRVLQAGHVATTGLFTDKTRPTIAKTRVMAGGQATVRQQVVRIDIEPKTQLAPDAEKSILSYIEASLPGMGAVILSDYGNYTVSPHITAFVIDASRKLGIPCIVDSRYNILDYKGVTLIKQNESELAAAFGLKRFDDEPALIRAGNSILEQLGSEAALITRGPEGMLLFERSGKIISIPVSNKSEVYDVTGAGDTVVAVMALALAAGASYERAAYLANYAAGIVVRKPGTATTSIAEMKGAIE